MIRNITRGTSGPEWRVLGSSARPTLYIWGRGFINMGGDICMLRVHDRALFISLMDTFSSFFHFWNFSYFSFLPEVFLPLLRCCVVYSTLIGQLPHSLIDWLIDLLIDHILIKKNASSKR